MSIASQRLGNPLFSLQRESLKGMNPVGLIDINMFYFPSEQNIRGFRSHYQYIRVY
jgi:hypothetical protein